MPTGQSPQIFRKFSAGDGAGQDHGTFDRADIDHIVGQDIPDHILEARQIVRHHNPGIERVWVWYGKSKSLI